MKGRQGEAVRSHRSADHAEGGHHLLRVGALSGEHRREGGGLGGGSGLALLVNRRLLLRQGQHFRRLGLRAEGVILRFDDTILRCWYAT